MDQTSKAKVTNFDNTSRGDKDIRGFEVTVENMTRMKIDKTVQELIDERFENSCGYWGT